MHHRTVPFSGDLRCEDAFGERGIGPDELWALQGITALPDGGCALVDHERLLFPGVPRLDPLGWSVAFLRRVSREDFPESPLLIERDGRLRERPRARE